MRKSKIRAAFTLCEGNASDAIRLLNGCQRKLQKQPVRCPSIQNVPLPVTKIVKPDENQNSNRNGGNETPVFEALLPPLGSFPKSWGVAPTATSPISVTNSSSDEDTTITVESVEKALAGVYKNFSY